MKKARLILICLTILLVVSSCNKSDKMSMETSCNDNSIDETKSIQEAYNNGSGQYENDNSVEDDKIKKIPGIFCRVFYFTDYLKYI